LFKFSLAIPPSLFGKKGAKLPKPTSGHHLIFSATFNLVGISFCHPATVVLAGRGGAKTGFRRQASDTHTPDRQQHHTALVTVSILYTIQLKRVLQNGGSVLLVNFVEN